MSRLDLKSESGFTSRNSWVLYRIDNDSLGVHEVSDSSSLNFSSNENNNNRGNFSDAFIALSLKSLSDVSAVSEALLSSPVSLFGSEELDIVHDSVTDGRWEGIGEDEAWSVVADKKLDMRITSGDVSEVGSKGLGSGPNDDNVGEVINHIGSAGESSLSHDKHTVSTVKDKGAFVLLSESMEPSNIRDVRVHGEKILSHNQDSILRILSSNLLNNLFIVINIKMFSSMNFTTTGLSTFIKAVMAEFVNDDVISLSSKS